MSKLCENCGLELEDGCSVCTSCGTFQTTGEEKADRALLRIKWTAPKILFAVAALLFLAALLVTEYFLSLEFYDGGGYSRAVENIVAVSNGNVRKIKSLAPREYWDEREKEGFSIDEYIEEAEKPETEAASKYSFKIQKSEKADADLIKMLDGQVCKLCGVESGLVSDAYRVDCDLIRTEGETEEITERQLFVVRIRNSWYPMLGGQFMTGVRAD